jgi:hypothetical protein
LTAPVIPIEPEPSQLETRALSLPQQARAIQIADQPTYDRAAALLLDVAAMRKEITDYHAPLKQKAFEAHRAICDAEKKMLAPITEAESVLKSSIATYTAEQRRKEEEARRLAALEAQRREEEARRKAALALEEQRRKEEEARLKAAVKAEERGAAPEVVQAILEQPPSITTEEVQAVIETPVYVAPRPVQPSFKAASGVVTRETWRAEVTSIRELCKAIAEGRASENFVTANMTALNQVARAMKTTFNVPGVRAVPETGVAAGRR